MKCDSLRRCCTSFPSSTDKSRSPSRLSWTSTPCRSRGSSVDSVWRRTGEMRRRKQMARGGCCSWRSSGKCNDASVLGRIMFGTMMVVAAVAGVTTMMEAVASAQGRAGTTTALARATASIAMSVTTSQGSEPSQGRRRRCSPTSMMSRRSL
jgi:hypothetical protein